MTPDEFRRVLGPVVADLAADNARALAATMREQLRAPRGSGWVVAHGLAQVVVIRERATCPAEQQMLAAICGRKGAA